MVSGVVTAAELLLADAEAPEMQPTLFPAAQIAALPAVPAQIGAGLTGEARDEAIARYRQGQLRVRKPGRPRGSTNRRTEAFADYVLRRSADHPIDGLIECYSRPVHELAAELGCSALEAFKAQQDARRVVLEYVESKQPIGIKADGNLVPVMFGIMPHQVPQDQRGFIEQSEQFQILIPEPEPGVGPNDVGQ